MSRTAILKLSGLFALLLSSSLPLGCADAAARAKQARPSDAFRAASAVPPEAPAAFEFEANGFSYHVAANGNGRRIKGEQTRRFNLRLGVGEQVRRLRFSEYEGDLLLLCETEGPEGDAAFVARIEQPSMRARWKQDTPPGRIEAVRQGGSLYLAGAGFIARLELRTGEYAWRHDAEAEAAKGEERIPPGRYGAPELSGDAVTFRPAEATGSTRPRVVRVNRKSGKIISIE